MNQPPNRRILLIDDTPSIHDDFRKILTPPPSLSPLPQRPLSPPSRCRPNQFLPHWNDQRSQTRRARLTARRKPRHSRKLRPALSQMARRSSRLPIREIHQKRQVPLRVCRRHSRQPMLAIISVT